MSKPRLVAALAGALLGALALAVPASAASTKFNPNNFSKPTMIDNPWLPLAAGNRWVYKETARDGSLQRVVVNPDRRTHVPPARPGISNPGGAARPHPDSMGGAIASTLNKVPISAGSIKRCAPLATSRAWVPLALRSSMARRCARPSRARNVACVTGP